MPTGIWRNTTRHFWATAASREALRSGYATIVGILELPEAGVQDRTLAMEAVQRWLSSHDRWVILDNADDLWFDALIFDSPSLTVDWLAHLHEKSWFQADDFFDMRDRFRRSTGSFGQESVTRPSVKGLAEE
jgi:hypothetical protein